MIPLPLLIAGLALGMKFASGASTAKKLEFNVDSLDWDGSKKQLYLVVDVINPSRGKLKITSIFISVFMNDTKIGSVEKADGFTIESTGRTRVKLPIKFNILGDVTLLKNIVIDKEKKFTVKALGQVVAMGLPVAVNKTFDFDATALKNF